MATRPARPRRSATMATAQRTNGLSDVDGQPLPANCEQGTQQEARGSAIMRGRHPVVVPHRFLLLRRHGLHHLPAHTHHLARLQPSLPLRRLGQHLPCRPRRRRTHSHLQVGQPLHRGRSHRIRAIPRWCQVRMRMTMRRRRKMTQMLGT